MFIKEYTSIRGEDLPYYAKKATWNILHAYIFAHRQLAQHFDQNRPHNSVVK